MRPLSTRSAAGAALLLLVFTSSAAAQGRGRGLGRGHGSSGPAAQPSTGGTVTAGTGVRHFGTWLDDATVQPKGKGWTTLGVGYSRALFGDQWDTPSIDAGIGVSKRVQLAITAPFSRVAYFDGSSIQGLGDAYIVSKVGLVDPEASGHSFGLAIAPMLEVLSSGSVQEGDGRVHWALPVTFERRFRAFRAYGSVEESVNDFANLLKNSPRYRHAAAAGADAQAYVDGISRSGYATDPEYAAKLTEILHGNTLRAAVKAIKL